MFCEIVISNNGHPLYPQHNVLIDDDGVPRLSDFGRSKFIDHRGFTTTLAGSARYMPPELIATEVDVDFDDDEAFDNEPPPSMTKRTDVYSFSMVALEVRDSHLGLACSSGSCQDV